jgi:hypothetical protein
MSNDALQIGDQEIVASKIKPMNGYGQNSYQGPSSDLPGQHTRIDGFGPVVAVPPRSSDGTADWQLRKISADPLPTTFGMAQAPAVKAVPHLHQTRGANGRRIS